MPDRSKPGLGYVGLDRVFYFQGRGKREIELRVLPVALTDTNIIPYVPAAVRGVAGIAPATVMDPAHDADDMDVMYFRHVHFTGCPIKVSHSARCVATSLKW